MWLGVSTSVEVPRVVFRFNLNDLLGNDPGEPVWAAVETARLGMEGTRSDGHPFHDGLRLRFGRAAHVY